MNDGANGTVLLVGLTSTGVTKPIRVDSSGIIQITS